MHSIKDYFKCEINIDHKLSVIEDDDDEIIYCKSCCNDRKFLMKCDSDCDNCFAVKNVIKKEKPKEEEGIKEGNTYVYKHTGEEVVIVTENKNSVCFSILKNGKNIIQDKDSFRTNFIKVKPFDKGYGKGYGIEMKEGKFYGYRFKDEQKFGYDWITGNFICGNDFRQNKLMEQCTAFMNLGKEEEVNKYLELLRINGHSVFEFNTMEELLNWLNYK